MRPTGTRERRSFNALSVLLTASTGCAMVGLGFLMLLLGLWGAWARWRHELYRSKLFLRFAVLMGPAGLVALLAGGVMRTKDAVSNHSALELSITLTVFIVMYLTVFGTGIRYML
jgi:cytochrome d ubiquinol oxidase subunit I